MFRVLFLTLILVGSVAFAHAEKVEPIPSPTTPLVLDEIGKSSDKDLIARFQVLKDKLLEESDITAYIINYGSESQIKKRKKQIQKALAFHKIDLKRVVSVYGGKFDWLTTKIYIVPQKVEPPTP